MRSTKLALSVLAIAVALGGPVYAANTTETPAKPAASSTQTAQANPAPAKHRLFHRRADNKKASEKASTSSSTSKATTGVH
jgi:hypothetical protein